MPERRGPAHRSGGAASVECAAVLAMRQSICFERERYGGRSHRFIPDAKPAPGDICAQNTSRVSKEEEVLQ